MIHPQVLGNSFTDSQELHLRLDRLINGQFASKAERLLASLGNRTPYRREASKLALRFAKYPRNESDSGVELKIQQYQFDNTYVHSMATFLRKRLPRDLVGAYVHGSLGTGEEIPYSDFDGLVIIRTDVLRDPEQLATTAFWLNKSRAIMLKMDPLQHHGWFVLPECYLRDFPETYFPRVLFQHAKTICGADSLVLANSRPEPTHSTSHFQRLAQATLSDITSRRFSRNLYYLKSTLSKFMLLPACYLQAKTGEAIFKKQSFELAREDFSSQQWSVMNQVSAIREDWDYELGSLRHRLVCMPNAFGKLVQRRLAPPVPASLLKKLDDRWEKRAGELVQQMLGQSQIASALH